MKAKKLLGLIIVYLLFTNMLFAQVFPSGNMQTALPDYQSMLFKISVSGLSSQTDASFGLESVCIDIQHPNINDLVVKLISPDNIETLLVGYYIGTNYTGTCFNGSAPNMISEGTAPFTGYYRPEEDLGKNNYYKNPNGNWKLQIIDTKQGNSGTINNWSLTFSNNPAKPFVESELPIMVINTKGQFIAREKRIVVDVGIISNGDQQINRLSDPWNHYSGLGSIRYRGRSSMMFPKKGYAFDTETINGENLEVPLLGMPANNKWVLYASYNDKTLLRNVFSYELFEKMGHYSVRSRYVVLIINGNYMGVYVLTEKIKRGKEQVPISKLAPEDIAGDDLTGGYIISIDKKSSNRDGWSSNFPSNSKNQPVFFQYEYPKQKNIQQVQKDYIRAYFNEFENTLMASHFKDPFIGYRKYIDVRSFYDNFIINELSKDIDGYRISTYFYKDKDSEGGKIINGPVWDFDLAWYNSNYGGGDQVAGWQYQFGWSWQAPPPGEETFPTPFWWRKFMEDPVFVNELNCRYQNLRLKELSIDNLYKMIDKTAAEIKKEREKNFQYWPIMGKWVYSNVTPVAKTYEEEVQRMKDWIKNRMAWIDTNIPGGCADVGLKSQDLKVSSFSAFPNPCTDNLTLNYYISNSANVKIEIINSLGITVVQILNEQQNSGLYSEKIDAHSLAKGIYLVKLTTDNTIYHQKIIKN
ncbi:MAG: CotH kinase family protein [Bacteroidetes bacterium]|nr:CotH kinase family protein [Bacteroidota bacterium]HET6243038.1 CotH kinase family protein [Bacteroidia bacterium]